MLRPGAPIAVVAPSGVYDPAKLDAGLTIARERGLDARPFADMLRPDRYLAASDERRRRDLVEALTSDDYAAVWIARGGYGLTRLLDQLPYDLVADRPIVGFSDVTALFAALTVRDVRATCIHGPMPHSLPATDAPSRDALFAALRGEGGRLVGETWVPGDADGWLCGGNLAMFAALCGTPFQLSFAGAIVVLEDIGEAPYRIDRMLQQLESAGAFDGVAAVVFGEFTRCDPPAGAPWTLREVLVERFARRGVPVVGEVPVGHGSRNHAFPWGVAASVRDGIVAWSPGDRLR